MTKENVDLILRLRLLRHRQTPLHLKRVKPTPWREHPYFYSWCLLFIWRFSVNKNLSGCFFLYVLVSYAISSSAILFLIQRFLILSLIGSRINQLLVIVYTLSYPWEKHLLLNQINFST